MWRPILAVVTNLVLVLVLTTHRKWADVPEPNSGAAPTV
jgi:hypothetical protein